MEVRDENVVHAFKGAQKKVGHFISYSGFHHYFLDADMMSSVALCAGFITVNVT